MIPSPRSNWARLYYRTQINRVPPPSKQPTPSSYIGPEVVPVSQSHPPFSSPVPDGSSLMISFFGLLTGINRNLEIPARCLEMSPRGELLRALSRAIIPPDQT